MASNYGRTSKRSIRRNRHRSKAPFQPANTGKPERTGSAGTRVYKYY